MKLKQYDWQDLAHKLKNLPASEIKNLVEHSVINHHANGMNYLCLERSENRTVKIYHIPFPVNENGGFLVNPHNHRYSFQSAILAGSLHHIRFGLSKLDHGKKYDQYGYDWETKTVKHESEVYMYPMRDDLCKIGSWYSVEPHEIHTLKILEPTVIGLVQEEDQNVEARLFMKTGERFRKPDSRKPTTAEFFHIFEDVMRLVGNV